MQSESWKTICDSFLIFVDIFPQGNLKEEIKQLQEAEEQVKNRAAELTQKKETFKVRALTSLNMHTFSLADKNYKRSSLTCSLGVCYKLH